MYKITANGNKPAHGVKEYLVNTFADLADIELKNSVASGSKAFASNEDQWYVLDLSRKWVKMTAASPGSGGSGDDSEGGGEGGGDTSEDVVYEGGDL